MKNEHIGICVIGDSITYGEGDSEQGSWVQRLRLSLERSFPEVGPVIYNLGIPGDTTADCLKRIENELSAREPTHVVLAVGINDSVYRGSRDNNEVRFGRFSENLGKLIEISRRFAGSNVAYVGLTRVNEALVQPFPGGTTGKSFANDVIGTYDESVRNLCADQKVTYIKMADVLTDEDLLDGLHPSAIGYAKMHDRIKPIVERMIKTM